MAGIDDLKFGLATTLSYTILDTGADVKVNPGGKANITGKHVQSPGEDSPPLPDDFATMVPSIAEGSINIVGYVDPKNTLIANGGEKRRYARDAEGNIVSVIWQRNDGSILIMNDKGMLLLNPDGSQKGSNEKGFYELEAEGDFNANGAIMDAATGDVTTKSGVSLDTLKADFDTQVTTYDAHLHGGVTTGLGSTGGPEDP